MYIFNGGCKTPALGESWRSLNILFWNILSVTESPQDSWLHEISQLIFSHVNLLSKPRRIQLAGFSGRSRMSFYVKTSGSSLGLTFDMFESAGPQSDRAKLGFI